MICCFSTMRLLESLLWVIPWIQPILCSCFLDYIRIENETSNSATVLWKGVCDIGSPIEVHHLRWLACPKEMPSHIPAAQAVTTEEESLTLSGLVPYSLYQVEFGGREARFRTGPDVPDIRPTFLANRPGKQSFHLEWKRNQENDCIMQNGVLDGFRVELWGLSPWVLDGSGPLESVNVQENIYEYYFHQLKAFTTYGLRVYARNKGVAEVNPGVYLKIKATTLPTRPNPPSSVRIKPLNRSIFIDWDPEYPPTGEVELYHIMLRETETDFIKKGYYVHQIDDRPMCSRDKKIVCWVVSYKDIEFGVNYTLTIRTKNSKIDEYSVDSKRYSFVIPSLSTEPSVQESQYETIDHEENADDASDDFQFYNYLTLIIVIVLIAAITILLIIVVALVFKIKSNKLKSAPYENHQLAAYYRRGSASTHITSVGYGDSYVDRVNDIQRRCLPDPPSLMKNNENKMSLEYSQVIDDDSDEHYLNVSEKPPPSHPPTTSKSEMDLDGYLTPSFTRKDNINNERINSLSSSSTHSLNLQREPTKIQMKSYDQIKRPPSSAENPSSCNYIDLDNVIHQSLEDLIHSKTSSVV